MPMPQLGRRDPSMYGEHHKCHRCGKGASEAKIYISKNTHWCRFCLDTEENPHLAGMTQEERDTLKTKNLTKVKVSIVNSNNLGFNM